MDLRCHRLQRLVVGADCKEEDHTLAGEFRTGRFGCPCGMFLADVFALAAELRCARPNWPHYLFEQCVPQHRYRVVYLRRRLEDDTGAVHPYRIHALFQ